MKKVLAIVLVVCVVCGAAAAFAQPRKVQNVETREHRNQQLDRPNGQPGEFCQPDGKFEGRGPRNARGFEGRCRGPRGMNFTPDMPKEIREKAAELAKLRVDLEEAMSSEPINKAKALDTYAKMQKLEQEIDAWRFAKKLERIEEFKKHRELNKKVPPAPMQPKPEVNEAPEK